VSVTTKVLDRRPAGDHRVLPSPYLVDEIEVALVVRGQPKIAPAAVFHQHEIAT